MPHAGGEVFIDRGPVPASGPVRPGLAPARVSNSVENDLVGHFEIDLFRVADGRSHWETSHPPRTKRDKRINLEARKILVITHTEKLL